MIRTELPDPLKRTKENFAENTVISAYTNGKYFYPNHPTPYLLIANSANAGNYSVNKQDITITNRQFCFLNEGDDLEINFARPAHRHTLLVLFNRSFVRGMLHNKLSTEEQLLEGPEQATVDLQIPPVPFFTNRAISQQLDKIKNDPALSPGDLDELLSAIISEFLLVNDDTAKQLTKINAIKKSTQEELYRRLSIALCYMHDNLATQITIEQIAKIAFMNRFHFLRTFKKVYGITPYSFLLQLKLQKAHEWLKNKKQSVTGACYSLGFESIGSFSNLFKDHFGYPPSQLLRDS